MIRLVCQFCLYGVLLLLSKGAFAIDPYRQSVRSLGTAGSYSAFADDESAFYLSPAGLGRHGEVRKIFVHSKFEDRVNDWTLQAALIDGYTEAPLTWGFLFNTINTPVEQTEDYVLSTSYNYDEFLFFGFQNRLSIAHASATTSEKTVFSLSGNIMAMLGDHFTATLYGRNLYRTERAGDIMPLTFGGALSLNTEIARASIEFERDDSHELNHIRLGAELMPEDFFIIRAGYSQDTDSNNRGYGVGLSIIGADKRLSIDGSFFDELDSNYYIFASGLSIRFK